MHSYFITHCYNPFHLLYYPFLHPLSSPSRHFLSLTPPLTSLSPLPDMTGNPSKVYAVDGSSGDATVAATTKGVTTATGAGAGATAGGGMSMSTVAAVGAGLLGMVGLGAGAVYLANKEKEKQLAAASAAAQGLQVMDS